MTGTPFERESRRARKRRKERERQATGVAPAVAPPQLAIRDVFSPGQERATDPEPIVEVNPAESVSDFAEAGFIDVAAAVAELERAPGSLPETASEQLAALQHELQEKDELLGALTAQLEEAANRLDRLHRAGADRGPRVSAPESDGPTYNGESGGPLAKLCSAWEELQLGDQFETIRSRLDDIFDAVTLTRRDESYPSPRVSETSAARPGDSASKLPGWEAMKAQLLRDGADHNRTQEDVSARVEDSAADVLNDLPLEPPAPVDLESADRELLETAVEERDVFISHLIRRLRSGTSGRYAPINWAEISGAPDELRERLQEHEARLQELLRMEECDLSLERARLARERARLEQLRRDLDRDARGGDRDGGDDSDRNERRWLRVFGFGRKDGVGLER